MLKTTDNSEQDLKKALAEMESKYRRIQALSFGAVCVAGAALFGAPLTNATASSDPEEIRATRFVVVGSDGRPRARFGVSPGGGAALRIPGDVGQPGVWVGVHASGLQGLAVFDKKGVPLIQLQTTDGQRPMLTYTDKQGRRRATFGIDQDGAVALEMGGSDQKLRLAIGVNADKQPMVTLLDGDERLRASFHLTRNNAAALSFFPKQEPWTFELGSAGLDDTVSLRLQDPSGSTAWKAP